MEFLPEDEAEDLVREFEWVFDSVVKKVDAPLRRKRFANRGSLIIALPGKNAYWGPNLQGYEKA